MIFQLCGVEFIIKANMTLINVQHVVSSSRPQAVANKVRSTYLDVISAW